MWITSTFRVLCQSIRESGKVLLVDKPRSLCSVCMFSKVRRDGDQRMATISALLHTNPFTMSSFSPNAAKRCRDRERKWRKSGKCWVVPTLGLRKSSFTQSQGRKSEKRRKDEKRWSQQYVPRHVIIIFYFLGHSYCREFNIPSYYNSLVPTLAREPRSTAERPALVFPAEWLFPHLVRVSRIVHHIHSIWLWNTFTSCLTTTWPSTREWLFRIRIKLGIPYRKRPMIW